MVVRTTEDAARQIAETARELVRDPRTGLLDYEFALSPQLDRPSHLEPIAAELERAVREPISLVVNVPPQHGKSTLLFHFIPWVLRAHSIPVLWITYSEDFAFSQMRDARAIAERAELGIDERKSKVLEWRLRNGGRLNAAGVGGDISGRPGVLILIDNSIKDWVNAQSNAIRERTDHWMVSSVLSRRHPSSSVVVVDTRWHEDDLGGRLVRRGWQHINLPAISDTGQALWPSHRPLDFLERQQAENPWLFEAIYQGRPRPRGAEVFGLPATCELADIPAHGRNGAGVDFAYSKSSKADYNVCLVLRESGGSYWVTDVTRKQARAIDFSLAAKSTMQRANAPIARWYCSGVEQGVADFMREHGLRLDARTVGTDKLVRAQRAAAAWNTGRIHVPTDAPWSQSFIAEVCAFTGASDAYDDQVDALAAAFDSLQSGASGSETALPGTDHDMPRGVKREQAAYY